MVTNPNFDRLARSILEGVERRGESPTPPKIPAGVRARCQELRRRAGRRYLTAAFGSFELSADSEAKRRQVEVLDALREYREDLEANVALGRGVLLAGPSGTGKDHLLVALGCVAAGLLAIEVEIVVGSTLWAQLLDTVGDRGAEAHLASRLTAPGLLILSDPLPPVAAGRDRSSLTEYQTRFLHRVLDDRARALRPVWSSVNVADEAELERRIGVANASRLADGALVCRCSWPSYRQPSRVVGEVEQ